MRLGNKQRPRKSSLSLSGLVAADEVLNVHILAWAAVPLNGASHGGTDWS